jgi:hypothetical protein
MVAAILRRCRLAPAAVILATEIITGAGFHH